MDTATTAPSGSTTANTTNPPSIELAYKKKCIQLKKRLNEIEAENDLIRVRNKRAKFYVEKMRLETCIMLERLATVTGMLDEAGTTTVDGVAAAGGKGGEHISAELRAKAAAIVQNAQMRAQDNQDVMDDETEGSSEERPPTPRERPLRVKRSRKSNIAFEEIEAEAEAAMQYETGSPEKPADSNGNKNYNNRNNDGDDMQDDNNHSFLPSSPPPAASASRSSDKETSQNLAPASATAGASDDRRSSGFRAVNKVESDEGSVPMDVDEKPSKAEN